MKIAVIPDCLSSFWDKVVRFRLYYPSASSGVCTEERITVHF